MAIENGISIFRLFANAQSLSIGESISNQRRIIKKTLFHYSFILKWKGRGLVEFWPKWPMRQMSGCFSVFRVTLWIYEFCLFLCRVMTKWPKGVQQWACRQKFRAGKRKTPVELILTTWSNGSGSGTNRARHRPPQKSSGSMKPRYHHNTFQLIL